MLIKKALERHQDRKKRLDKAIEFLERRIQVKSGKEQSVAKDTPADDKR
jgi:cell division septum initiation protein DivIVA